MSGIPVSTVCTPFGGTGIPTDIDMKYSQTVNLAAEAETDITTTLTTEPYSLEFIDATGIVITTGLGQPVLTVVGGVYHVSVYSVDVLNNVKLKIIY